MTGNKWALVVVGVVVCAVLAYVGYSQRAFLLSLKNKVPFLRSNSQSAAAVLRPEGAEGEETFDREALQKQQEEIAKSIAEQQSISQQIHETTMRSISDVQRTLRSIQDINRINRSNQQLQQQLNRNP